MKKNNQRSPRPRKTQNHAHEGNKTAETVTAEPLYKRAKNLAGVVSVLGVAWFTIHATRRWLGNRNDET